MKLSDLEILVQQMRQYATENGRINALSGRNYVRYRVG